jgi:hypothetical protein
VASDVRKKKKHAKFLTCISSNAVVIHILVTGWRTLRDFSDLREFCLHFREK